MRQHSLDHDRRVAILHDANALLDAWRKLGAVDSGSALAFKARRNLIVEDARELLAGERLLGVWEADLLDRAVEAPLHYNRLAMSEVVRALNIAEDRATGKMPMWHYDQEAAKIATRAGPKSPLAIE